MAMTRNISDDWMDSTLWMPDGGSSGNAELWIKIKVYLLRHPARTITYQNEDGSERSVQTRDWDASRSHSFPRDLKRVVEAGWDNRLWLVPGSEWRAQRTAPNDMTWGRSAPSIACRLQIEFVPRSEAHILINCFCLDRGQFNRSNMWGPFSGYARRCSMRGGELRGNMDTNDVYPKDSGQIPAVHEFGHYIGLSHVNARAVVAAAQASGATPDTNSRLAYGVGDQRQDMMGAGDRIAKWHAYPWCRRLRRHLGGEQPRSTGWHSEGATMAWATGSGPTETIWRVHTTPHGAAWVGANPDIALDA